MAQVERTLPAEVDLLQIWTYLAPRNIEAADKVLQAIAQKCQDCAELPGMGRRRDDLAPGLRSIVSGSYLIVYRPVDDGIRLLRILHGARDLPSQFE